MLGDGHQESTLVAVSGGEPRLPLDRRREARVQVAAVQQEGKEGVGTVGFRLGREHSRGGPGGALGLRATVMEMYIVAAERQLAGRRVPDHPATHDHDSHGSAHQPHPAGGSLRKAASRSTVAATSAGSTASNGECE